MSGFESQRRGLIGSAEALLAAIVQSSEDAIVSKDLNGTIQTWNAGAERIFGYAADEIVGTSILRLIPPGRENEEEMILARIRKGERVEHFETQRQRKDGRLIDVSVTVSPIRDHSGAVVGASKVARDVSDRVVAETLRARLAAIVESSDDAIVSKSMQGIVESWNKGAERLFGFMAEEMIGQSISKIIPPDRLDEEERILRRLKRGDRVDHFETKRMRKDGSLVDVSVTISPIPDSHGKIIGASKVARDITDRKILESTMARLKEDLEERVRERTAALEAAHREMESFTYSVSHDFRGPLRAIASTSAMIIEDFEEALPEGAKHLLERQIMASKRLARLMEDLLQYARLGQAELSKKSVDLTTLAKELSQELHQQYANCDLLIEHGLLAVGDENLLRLLLQNLLDNACKFSPQGGKVTFGKTADVFYVRDEGVGFDMAYADRIFAPFERLVRTDETEGTGIGLANVQRIVHKHSGRVWVDSRPGAGTTFYFALPNA